jgi:ankyrin repeat protein
MAQIDALLATVNRGKDTAAVREFINSGIDINTHHPDAGSALMAASLQGHQAMVDTLLELGAAVDQQHGSTQMSPLHMAAANGHVDVVALLLNSGASVDAHDDQQWTPLMFAAQEGHTQVVTTLLAAGADVDSGDDHGCSALMQAARSGHSDAAQTLLDHDADANFIADWATPLIMAAAAGRVNVVTLLLDAGAELDFLHPEDGYSALMLAALQGHSEVVRLLLAHGADVNQQTTWSVNALIMAQRGKQRTVETLLFDAGANPVNEVPQPVHTAAGWTGDPMLVAAAH